MGKGSTFIVSVPTGPIQGVRWIEGKQASGSVSQANAACVAMQIAGARILLAEDGEDNQRLISFVLRKAGANVVMAENGQLACSLAKDALAKGQPFDIILMDMQMPVLDGYSATRHLREINYEGPIIALTAHAMNHDRQKCLDAGCDDYITKPIDRLHLIQTLAGYYVANSLQHVD